MINQDRIDGLFGNAFQCILGIDSYCAILSTLGFSTECNLIQSECAIALKKHVTDNPITKENNSDLNLAALDFQELYKVLFEFIEQISFLCKKAADQNLIQKYLNDEI